MTTHADELPELAQIRRHTHGRFSACARCQSASAERLDRLDRSAVRTNHRPGLAAALNDSLNSDAVKIGYGTIKSSMPWIEGDPRVDQTLHVIKGEWSAQAEFLYSSDRCDPSARNVMHRWCGRLPCALAAGL